MKSILYVGATLMIGASIYGFVDYKKASRQNEFTKMYKAKEIPETPVKEKGFTEKKMEKIISVNEDQTKHQTVTENKIIGNSATPVKVSLNENKTTGKFKTGKRKMSYKSFSRAALDERFIEKDIKPGEPVKEKN